MSEREHRGRTIRQEISIRATPEEIWDAWARHDRIDKWFVDRAEGDMGRDAVVKWFFDAFGYELPVHVIEAARPEYLAFGGPQDGGQSALQEIWIRRDGGASVVRLANSGFREGPEWEEEYQGVDSGWRMALATLKHWLENHPREPRKQLFLVQPAGFEYADLNRLYTTRDGLVRWLADAVESPREELGVGDRVAITLRGGERLSGRVLANTGREACVEWSERRGVLSLKAFEMGPAGRCTALAFSGWGIDENAVRAVKTTLERAHADLLELLGPPRPRAALNVPDVVQRGQA